MRVGVVGINHKQAKLKLREILALTCEKRFGAGCSIHTDHHFVLLSTCNRTEIYFASDDPAVTHEYILKILRDEIEEEFDQKLYAFFGKDCLHHLSRVTAGLDSAIVCETEIQGQVKGSYALAKRNLPKDLHFLFQKGLKNGKLVRSKLQLCRGIPDIEHAVYDEVMKVDASTVLFVGASQINQRILNFFEKKGMKLTICNRTREKAEKFGVEVLSWECLEQWKQFDAVIVGTKAPYPIIRQTHSIKSKIVIDLSVPRNVALNGIPVKNIDELHTTLSRRKGQVTDALTHGEALIQKAVENQTSNISKNYRPPKISKYGSYI